MRMSVCVYQYNKNDVCMYLRKIRSYRVKLNVPSAAEAQVTASYRKAKILLNNQREKKKLNKSFISVSACMSACECVKNPVALCTRELRSTTRLQHKKKTSGSLVHKNVQHCQIFYLEFFFQLFGNLWNTWFRIRFAIVNITA